MIFCVCCAFYCVCLYCMYVTALPPVGVIKVDDDDDDDDKSNKRN